MWIQRDIARFLAQNKDHVQIVIGPRQCGKSSLLLHLSNDHFEVNLDDLQTRTMAQEDPQLLFSQAKGRPIIIDEAQLAPEVFFYIKKEVDLYKRNKKPRKILFQLTGSNQILMDKSVKESLAGRASYYEMSTLSVAEILSHRNLPISEILFKGGWPELYVDDDLNASRYIDDYINSYIEKDIILSAGIQKSRDFLMFCKLLAARTGTLLNASQLGSDVGVEQSTIRDWVSVLERMKIISLVSPYFSNLTSRLVKRPKVYFLDTGLAARLQGWSDATTLLLSPASGLLFENLVFAEIYKTMINLRKKWQIFHWRSRDGEEIDFLIKGENQTQLFVEVKKTAQKLVNIQQFSEVKKIFKNKIPKIIQCHMEGDGVIDGVIPIAKLKSHLLAELD